MSTLPAQTYLTASEYLTWQHLEDTLSLAAIECTLPVRDLYRRVRFNAL